MRPLSPFASRRSLGLSCLGLFCLGFALAACQGSVKGDAKASAASSGDADVDFDTASDTSWENASTPGVSEAKQGPAQAEQVASSAAPSSAPALLGARHDLQLEPGRAATCRCLAVQVGAANASGFVWKATPPRLDPRSQLVVGLSSNGVACDDQAEAASYKGYQPHGSDVVVQVEAAVAGRPLTQGAIIPRPKPGGRVLIESSSELPYGHALEGNGACVITL